MSFASICCPLTPLADSSLSSFATGICDVYRLAAVCSSVLPFGAPNWQEIGKVFDPKAGRLLPTTASKVFLVRPLRTIYLEKLFTRCALSSEDACGGGHNSAAPLVTSIKLSKP